jgi:phage terminase large subunit-like protein
VTPNAGKSIHIPRLIEEFKTAQDTSDEELRAWASQHLNIEIGLALQADSWAGAQFWEDQGDRALTLDELLERCEVWSSESTAAAWMTCSACPCWAASATTRDWLHWGTHGRTGSVLERRKDIGRIAAWDSRLTAT